MADSTDNAGFIDWATEAVGQVVAHVERHGVAITWTEAHKALLMHAGALGVTAGYRGEVYEPLCDPLGWRHPDFVESVACGRVHWAGRAYHPTRPGSEVPVGVSIHTVVQAQLRLSL